MSKETVRVLVVDDSQVELRLAKAILEARLDVSVQCARSGEDALQICRSGCHDVILTDLYMPDMDGLELLVELRNQGVTSPVILMTGNGSEQAVMTALRAGVASYVSKKEIQQHLAPTVEAVISTIVSRDQQQRLLQTLSQVQFEFQLESDVSLVGPLVTHVQNELLAVCGVADVDRSRLGMALHESLTNAIYHGNLEVSSDLRQVDEQVFYQMVDFRRMLSPWGHRQVHVSVRATRYEVEFCIRDEGPGFDVKQTLKPADEVSFDRVGGRGMLLIRSFMDSVEHNDAGNEIRMSKSFANRTNTATKFKTTTTPDRVLSLV